MKGARSIHIPEELYEKAVRWIEKNGGFSSVDDLVKFLIEEFITEGEEDTYTPEEEEEIKERLKRLGYL